MHPTVHSLIRGAAAVERQEWEALWADLRARTLDRDDAIALLASLGTAVPPEPTLTSLVASLKQDCARPRFDRAVNVVGTGGGPATFNVSTGAAIVAAATGVQVVKTGSRAFSSRHGSVDLLDRLGIRSTRTEAETATSLDRHGIAFAGPYVYPGELTALARTVVPMGIAPFGRFFNTVGPFTADVGVGAQLTGVSDRSTLPLLRSLAAAAGRRVWLVANDAGADELLGFADNTIDDAHPADGGGDGVVPARLRPADLPAPFRRGTIEDLRPIADPAAAAAHFVDVLSGRHDSPAVRTVALNAGALAVLAGHPSWGGACEQAYEAIVDGRAADLLADLRRTRSAGQREAV